MTGWPRRGRVWSGQLLVRPVRNVYAALWFARAEEPNLWSFETAMKLGQIPALQRMLVFRSLVGGQSSAKARPRGCVRAAR